MSENRIKLEAFDRNNAKSDEKDEISIDPEGDVDLIRRNMRIISDLLSMVLMHNGGSIGIPDRDIKKLESISGNIELTSNESGIVLTYVPIDGQEIPACDSISTEKALEKSDLFQEMMKKYMDIKKSMIGLYKILWIVAQRDGGAINFTHTQAADVPKGIHIVTDVGDIGITVRPVSMLSDNATATSNSIII